METPKEYPISNIKIPVQPNEIFSQTVTNMILQCISFSQRCSNKEGVFTYPFRAILIVLTIEEVGMDKNKKVSAQAHPA